MNPSTSRFCIIGAGPAGLTAAKNFRQAGLQFDCFEAKQDVGGIWNSEEGQSSIHDATRMISSKRLTEFCGFRMPKNYPHYPNHQQVFSYLQQYAKAFELYPRIQFGSRVAAVRRLDQSRETAQGRWSVRIDGEDQPKIYDGVVVANGHHWQPRWPQFVDSDSGFAGEVIHAREYQSSEMLRGRRVLIVGAGNSGCDIAVEAANYAESATISMRRGYHFFPKFLFGAPLDRCGETMHRWGIRNALGGSLYRLITRCCLRIAVGPPEKAGLPKPDHQIFKSHPIVNSRIVDCVRNRQLRVAADVRRLTSTGVEFSDGAKEDFDLIICATGYDTSFPFLNSEDLAWPQQNPQLFLNVFDSDKEGLWFIGLIQPDGGIWQLADFQSQLLTLYLLSEQDADASKSIWFRKLTCEPLEKRRDGYLNSPRHRIEVDYFQYRDLLRKYIREFNRRGIVMPTTLRDYQAVAMVNA